jgi:hypothetical protein
VIGVGVGYVVYVGGGGGLYVEVDEVVGGIVEGKTTTPPSLTNHNSSLAVTPGGVQKPVGEEQGCPISLT